MKLKTYSFSEWHKILGHCNKSDMQKLEKICDGMNIENKTYFYCDTCV